MIFLNATDDSKFWKNYISKRITLRKPYIEERQNLILKSHRETMYAYDLSTEQDLYIGLELDVNHDFEILLMLKHMFLKDIKSFDPLPFAKAFMRAWPVSIKMYSQVFIYCLNCFVKISTDKREELLMSETILDCIDSFFMKTQGQSMTDAFNMCTKSYQQLSRGLILFKEKLLKDVKGFKISKSRANNDLLNDWSNMLLSVNAPPYFVVTMKSFNEVDDKIKRSDNIKNITLVKHNRRPVQKSKNKKKCASKIVLDGEDKLKINFVTKQKKKSKLATIAKSDLVIKSDVKSYLAMKNNVRTDLDMEHGVKSDLALKSNSKSDLAMKNYIKSDEDTEEGNESDMPSKRDIKPDLTGNDNATQDVDKNDNATSDFIILNETKSDLMYLDSKVDDGIDLDVQECRGSGLATKVASNLGQPVESEDITIQKPSKKLKKFVSPFNDRNV